MQGLEKREPLKVQVSMIARFYCHVLKTWSRIYGHLTLKYPQSVSFLEQRGFAGKHPSQTGPQRALFYP